MFRTPFVIRMRKRLCTFAVLLSICVFAILHVYMFRENKVPKTVYVVNPETKKHWFRLKIDKADSEHSQKHDRPKTILLWTKFFGNANYIPPLANLNCPKPHCLVTSNRSYLLQSDALVFHVRDMSMEDMPTVKLPSQRWILLHHESPPHTPDILKYLDGLFNWTATYRLDSDIGLNPQFTLREKRLSDLRDHAKGKSRMVAWFVSNCHTDSNREGYVKELQKSIDVDIYGLCGTKKCLPKMSPDCYKKVSAEYRYYLSFENSICKDYVTEKFFHILETDMVPVVFGGANYSLVAPSTSYIDAFSFQTPRELAHFLLAIAKDDRRYNSFFQWKTLYEMSNEHYACKICRKLHENPPPSVIENLHEWWFGESKCKTWNPNYYVV